MNWFQSFIFGLVSGAAEFLPISSRAHQSLLLHLFGVQAADPVLMLFIHGALLLSLYSGIRPVIEQIRREQGVMHRTGGRRRQPRMLADLQLVKNAAFPMIIGILLLYFIFRNTIPLPVVSLLLIVNGVLLYLPDRMLQGNKDAGKMSLFDSLLIGIAGAFSFLPGISRVGASASVALFRLADRQKAVNWAFLLSFPGLIVLACTDILSLISGIGVAPFFASIPGYLLAGIGAYISGFVSISAVKLLAVRSGFTGFAYYSWGMCLLTFLLYLIVV